MIVFIQSRTDHGAGIPFVSIDFEPLAGYEARRPEILVIELDQALVDWATVSYVPNASLIRIVSRETLSAGNTRSRKLVELIVERMKLLGYDVKQLD
jgi:hypothetical protein